jgi:AP-1 complex subunit gamma-1
LNTFLVSENKPVGSLQATDLLGEDDSSATRTSSNEARPAAAATTDTEDLLDQIFGNSSVTSPPPTTTSQVSPQPRNAIDDILGLFGSPAPVQAQSPSSTPSITQVPQSSAFSLPQMQSPPIQQQPPAPQRLTSYTAYDKNQLKVTLTPQTSAARPGLVNILARFQVSGTTPAIGLNFQAAVPKVRPWLVYGITH